MRRAIGSTFTVLAFAAAALAGCSDPEAETPGGAATETEDMATDEAMGDAVLSTADSELGEIVVDGELQVTVDGRPVYLYAGDSAPGDVAGQGVDGEWWAVGPDGSEITEGGG